jgi:hypothetical protein
MRQKAFYLLALIALILGIWLGARFFWGPLRPGQLVLLALSCWLAVSGLAWAARTLSHRVWVYAGLLILPVLCLPASFVVKIYPIRGAGPFGSEMALTILAMICTAVVVAALLLHSGLSLHKGWRNQDAVNDSDSKRRRLVGILAGINLILSALLLAKALHSFYWFMVWDSTTDPLGHYWLYFPILAVLFSGVLLSLTLPGRIKLASLTYLLLIPALVLVAVRAQRVDFRQLTDERAERVSQAIERYYARQGRYPRDLRQVTPWYLSSFPGPVIIYGQDWCYDGGDAQYRLGYVYREHWSDPRLSGQIYRAKGHVSDLSAMCKEEIVAIQTRYPQYPYAFRSDTE